MPVYSLHGKAPQLPPDNRCWIAPTAVLIGDVRLGEDASVWFGAVLRGDNERLTIGARANVQEGVTMHTDAGFPCTIGEDCTVGHNAILHSCTIGNGSLIGMGAIVLNGAKIGNHCLVGAGALVTENKTFPDGSLIVGSPAKVARELDEKTIAALLGSAERYVANWRRYAKGLKQVG